MRRILIWWLERKFDRTAGKLAIAEYRVCESDHATQFELRRDSIQRELTAIADQLSDLYREHAEAHRATRKTIPYVGKPHLTVM